MDLSDLTSAISSLDAGLRSATTALRLISTSTAKHDDDQFPSTISPFVKIAEPQLKKLWAMHSNVKEELASLLTFFGEDAEAKPEELFATILAFSSSLNRAAADQTRHLVKPDRQARDKVDSGVNLLLAAQRTGASEVDVGTADPGSAHTAQPSGTSSGSSASTLKDLKSVGEDRRSRNVSSGSGPLTLARNNPVNRQSLSRSQLNEAIQSIHGGVRRRDRTMRGVNGNGSVMEGVRTSKMMFDGTQGGTGKSRYLTVGKGTANSVLGSSSILGLPPIAKISGSPGRQLNDITFRVPS